jgi:hypothetical protein
MVRSRSFEINDKLKLGCLIKWDFSRFYSSETLVDLIGGMVIKVREVKCPRLRLSRPPPPTADASDHLDPAELFWPGVNRMVVHMVKSILLRIPTNGVRFATKLGGCRISLTIMRCLWLA